MMQKSIYNFKVKTLVGKEVDFNIFKGKTLLIVNTASKCGFTPQYDGLEILYQKYKDKGLVILGFPCNQFLNQEPGEGIAIQENCLINYGVSFPVFEKVNVNGKNAHPLFVFLKDVLPGFINNNVKWNFTKFLIDAKGNPIARFGSLTKPEKIENFLLKNKIL